MPLSQDDLIQSALLSSSLQRLAKLVDQEIEQLLGQRLPFTIFIWASNYAVHVHSAENLAQVNENIREWLKAADAGEGFNAFEQNKDKMN